MCEIYYNLYKFLSIYIIYFIVYLTHLDYADTERIMTEKLHNQVNGTEWSTKNLNSVRFLSIILCSFIGLSGKFCGFSFSLSFNKEVQKH